MKVSEFKHIKVLAPVLLILSLASCGEKEANTKDKGDLGKIVFENSGSEEAQEAFYRGVLAMHNFWYPLAESSFKEAREIDPDFAMAYWGEAMSNNKALWQIQNRDRALEILKELGETEEERTIKAKLDVEKDFIKSLDILFSEEEDKLERDLAYMSYMEKMNEKYPDNLEVRSFYALSLLGLLRDNQGNEDTRMKCAAVSQQILDVNPEHPGGLHYKIHALDDPLHAILALDAAYKYAEVAPRSNHALHMPSHIFVQLGMWENVISSNIDARKASESWVAEEGLDNTYLDDHSLAWLAYGYTQAGLFDSAMSQLNKIQQNNSDTSSKRTKHYEIDMLTRIWVENSSDLENLSFDVADLEILGKGDKSKFEFTKGWRSLESGEKDSCLSSIEKISTYKSEIDSSDLFDIAIVGIYLNSLKGLYSYETLGFSDAQTHFEKAVEIEESLNPPTGPPDIIKPIHELYAEICLKEGKLDKSISLFKTSLERTPNRSMSRLGLARAYRIKGDLASAKFQYEKLAENYARASNDDNQSEALSFIKNNEDVSSTDFLSDSKQELQYDSKLKITQCLPLN